jgi:hypothetical protein
MKVHMVQAKDGTIELKPIDATGTEQDDGADVPIVTEDRQDPISMSGPTVKKPHRKHKKHPRKKHTMENTKRKSRKDEVSPKITDHATCLLDYGISEEVDDGADVGTLEDDAPTALDGVVDNITMANEIIPAKAFLVEDTGDDDKGTGYDFDDIMGDLDSIDTAGSDDFAVEDLEAGTGTRNVASRPPQEHDECRRNPCCQICMAWWACILVWRIIVGISAAADCAEHC